MNRRKDLKLKPSYQDFITFLSIYKSDTKGKLFKTKHVNPYKYKKVFNKDKKNES